MHGLLYRSSVEVHGSLYKKKVHATLLNSLKVHGIFLKFTYHQRPQRNPSQVSVAYLYFQQV